MPHKLALLTDAERETVDDAKTLADWSDADPETVRDLVAIIERLATPSQYGSRFGDWGQEAWSHSRTGDDNVPLHPHRRKDDPT